MTRYMLIFRTTPEAEKAMENVDFNEVIAAMGRYNVELIKAGVLLAGRAWQDRRMASSSTSTQTPRW